MPSSDSSAVVDDLVEQAHELCNVHDHITRIVTNLNISQGISSNQYSHSGKAQFDFEPAVRMFLYQYAREFNDNQVFGMCIYNRRAGINYTATE